MYLKDTDMKQKQGTPNYSKGPKSVTTFDLFVFFRADLIQSEARWKLLSTFDWLMSALKTVC